MPPVASQVLALMGAGLHWGVKTDDLPASGVETVIQAAAGERRLSDYAVKKKDPRGTQMGESLSKTYLVRYTS
jgi:hypothetical protein